LWAQLPRDGRVIFVGDIVTRAAVAGIAAFCARPGRAAVVLLGNHDLHLLAVDAGIRPPTTTTRLE